MPAVARLIFLLCCLSPLSFGGVWSGVLVDSKCWTNEQRNVNPSDTSTFVDRDRNWELSFCKPRAKTQSFAVVSPDGTSLRLDSAGNAKAADLVRNTGKQRIYRVAVTGNVNNRTVNVDSIALSH